MKDLRFFARQKELTNSWQRIAWWEIRRVPYNLIVALAGIISLILIFVSAAIAERMTGVQVGLPDPPLFALVGILIYAVLANVCYTGGWVAEIIVVNVWGEAGKHFGVISFTLGLLFSVLLTLLIGALFAGMNVLQILLHLIGYPIID